MSYSGAGVFNINSAGQPVVAATTISSTVFNALTADLATGLSTAICKDGQTTTTASIPFVQGIAVTTGITTPSTTFALANTTATTVNFAGGASTALNIGHASGTNTVLGATAFSQALSPNGGITLGANYISRAGTAAGFSLDASNNATLSGTLTVSGAGTSAFSSSNSGATNSLQIANLSNTASSSARLIVSVGGSSGGDAYSYYLISGEYEWSVGVLNSDNSFNITSQDGLSSNKKLTINTSGNTTLSGTLTVSGNTVSGSGAGTLRADGGLRIGADSTNNLLDDASTGAGTATLYIGNASINVTSDENVKSNITPLEDGLSIINALHPIEFDQDEERPWGDQRHYMGFGARASHKVAPWAVHTQGDTGLPWKMRQEFLMAPTVRAVQQLAERLAKLEARLA